MEVKHEKIGEIIEPVLKEISDIFWEHEASRGDLKGFSEKSLWYSTKIFTCVMLEAMWHLQKRENIDMHDRKEMTSSLGKEIRELVKNYTDKDTFEFWK